jgi:hypothetical protein
MTLARMNSQRLTNGKGDLPRSDQRKDADDSLLGHRHSRKESEKIESLDQNRGKAGGSLLKRIIRLLLLNTWLMVEAMPPGMCMPSLWCAKLVMTWLMKGHDKGGGSILDDWRGQRAAYLFFSTA